jgi:hypothetical protein
MLSWQSLTGAGDDPLGRILYATAMVFTALLLAVTTVLAIVVSTLTVRAVARGQICVPE